MVTYILTSNTKISYLLISYYIAFHNFVKENGAIKMILYIKIVLIYHLLFCFSKYGLVDFSPTFIAVYKYLGHATVSESSRDA